MGSKDQTDRRQTPERRDASKRRRHAETRSVHIELCHSVLRVVVVVNDGSSDLPALRACTVRWRHNAPSVISDQGKAELTAALRQLVTDNRLAGCKVTLAINSKHCVNRATSGPTAKVEQEIADLLERSQLYLALGPGPKTTAVGRKHLDARHEHALLTVTNETTLELLVGAAEAAGLVVDVVESSLVALSRLQGVIEKNEPSAAILAQLDEDRFELGVSRMGELLLEYRPAPNTTSAQLGESVNDHYERLKRFCGRQYGAGSIDLKRMWLVGDADEVSRANTKTRRTIDVGVLPLDCLNEYWRVEGETEISAEMGAALGLALRGRLEEGGVSPNLMDEIHARAKAPIKPFLIRAGAPVAATLLAAASLWLLNLEQRAELSALRLRVETARPTQLLGARLRRELTDTVVEIEHLSDLRSKIPSQELTAVVQRIGQCLPDDVWLKSLRLSEKEQLSVQGASYTEGGVYDFVRYLDEAPMFGEVALKGTGSESTPKGPATRFDIDLLWTPAAPAPKERGDD